MHRLPQADNERTLAVRLQEDPHFGRTQYRVAHFRWTEVPSENSLCHLYLFAVQQAGLAHPVVGSDILISTQ